MRGDPERRIIIRSGPAEEEPPEAHPKPLALEDARREVKLEPGSGPSSWGKRLSDKDKGKSIDLDEPPPEPPGAVLGKIHEKLRDKAELVKLHLKHYHLNTQNFKKRTSALKIPKDIIDMWEEVVKECPACQKNAPAPERSRVTGMRADNF